jgi:hypothetical protein
MINRQTLTILNIYLQANDEIKREIEDIIYDLAKDRNESKEEQHG